MDRGVNSTPLQSYGFMQAGMFNCSLSSSHSCIFMPSWLAVSDHQEIQVKVSTKMAVPLNSKRDNGSVHGDSVSAN